MTEITSTPPKTSSRRSLIGLALVFIVGFGLQATLNYSIERLMLEQDRLTESAQARTEISDQLVLSLQAIETDFYRLTITENLDYRHERLEQIQLRKQKIDRYLALLSQGGSLTADESVQLELTFQKIEGSPLAKLGLKNVSYQLEQLMEQLIQFEFLLVQRDQLMQQPNQQLTEIMLNIRQSIRRLSPGFEALRLQAQTARADFQSELLEIRQQVELEKEVYRYWQMTLVISVLLLGLLIIEILSNQIRRVHQKLQDSEAYISDVLESQSNIIVVTDGVKIINTSGGFFNFFTKYQNLDQFLAQHQCICETFIKEPGLIYKFEDKNWVEYILQNPNQRHRAKIQRATKTHTFEIMATRSARYQRYILSLFDVTEIEQMAENLELEKNRALASTKSKSEFLANMSHEIRTPLNAILGFISLLKEQETDAERLRYLTTVHNSSHSLLAIINDILDFSKIENNRLDLDQVDFNPYEEFRSTAHLFDAKCEEKNLTFEVNLDSSLPASLHSDPLRIKQVLSNLLSNAVKFTPSGKRVRLQMTYKADEQRLYCEVADQGIGIAEDKQRHIFEAFSQAESSTTRQYGGTGLGLSISARLIALLGGELKLHSKLGEGSCFYFEIPIKIGESVTPKPTPKSDQPNLHGRVLLVEDNPTNQMLMKVLLKKLGLSFEVAEDGLQAIGCYEQGEFDAILMDENMPNMNGIEATQAIRRYEQHHDLPPVPIIALTANAIKGDRERFLAAGMDEYLTKPIDFVLLRETLHRFLQ
jgi:signal transduction histidine kinase/CheY-like chemotaxis protein